MIELTKLNGHKIFINSDLIKYIEPAPDTMITLVTNEKIMVLESCDGVVEQTFRYRQQLFASAWPGFSEALAAKLANELSNSNR